MNGTPLVIQYTTLFNKWGAVLYAGSFFKLNLFDSVNTKAIIYNLKVIVKLHL